VTFAEAFERTGRHVTISVSASALSGIEGAEELLLNHVTTPNVLIRSAVMASCSLPLLFKPNRLLAKKSSGEIGPFYLNGEPGMYNARHRMSLGTCSHADQQGQP
jgi:predicted acylesterase/phospholipase RssA